MGFLFCMGIANIFIVGLFISNTISLIFKNSIFSRVLKVFLIIYVCFEYAKRYNDAFGILSGEYRDENFTEATILLIGPLAATLIVFVIAYIVKGNNPKKS